MHIINSTVYMSKDSFGDQRYIFIHHGNTSQIDPKYVSDFENPHRPVLDFAAEGEAYVHLYTVIDSEVPQVVVDRLNHINEMNREALASVCD